MLITSCQSNWCTVSATSEPGSSGRLKLDTLKLPTAETLTQLTADLSASLTEALDEAGIATAPDFRMDVDPYSGHIEVSGKRADTAEIEELLNGNATLADQIRTTHAIASHVAGMRESLSFQQEYLSSDDPAAVVAKYSALFNGPRSSDVLLEYSDGTASSEE